MNDTAVDDVIAEWVADGWRVLIECNPTYVIVGLSRDPNIESVSYCHVVETGDTLGAVVQLLLDSGKVARR